MFGAQNVYSPPNDEYVNQEIKRLEEIAMAFMASAVNIPFSRLQVNAKTLKDIIIRIHKRKRYFDYFHNRTVINQLKEVALYVYWIVKLRPFWVAIENSDDDIVIDSATRINEKISAFMLLSIIKRYNEDFINHGKNLAEDYIDELLYSFRYRDISKEAMYLMLDPFYYWHYFYQCVDKSGEELL